MTNPDRLAMEELTDAINRNAAGLRKVEDKLDVLNRATGELWLAIRGYTELMRGTYEEMLKVAKGGK